MDIENEVLELIDFIKEKMKEMNLDAQDVFLNGNCGNLYKILVSKFSKYTEPYVIKENNYPLHIVTKIQGKFYDITGETSLEKYLEYVKTHNSTRIKDEDFSIDKCSVADPILNQMCDMYRYNEEFEQSEIENQMSNLLSAIKTRECR